MKSYNFNKLLLAFASITVIFASSCQKALDINVDPNKSPTSTVVLALPASQVGMAIAVGNWNFTGCMWAQYWTGGHGVGSSNLERYNMTGSDVETGWSHAYSKSLADLDFLIRSDQPVYSGMGKIMSAYLYQMLADLFGNVPFTEALKGAPEDGSILAPKFDDPKTTIYPALIALLDEAIADVQQTGPLVQTPGADDLIYGGNINNWVAFANTLKLKLLVRQGDKNTEALALINSGVSFIDESNHSAVRFTESTRNTNPLYQRFTGSGLGMYYMAAAASIDTLKNFLGENVPDPRIAKLYSLPTNGSFPFFRGILSGEVNNTTAFPDYKLLAGETAPQGRAKFSAVNPTVYNFNIPVYFLSGWESKFLQAEVLIKAGQDASTLFDEGVQASFNILGIGGSAPAYLAALGFDPSASIDDQLDDLGIQKWISMNGLQMTEGWLESVRFDRPGHLIFSGADSPSFNSVFTNPSQNVLGTRIFPTSFVYPTQEVANNPNTPAGRAVTDKRFWDN